MRIFVSIAAAAFVIFLYWVGGGNFERGPGLMLSLVFASWFGALAYSDHTWRG
jgi:hypothetical protein